MKEFIQTANRLSVKYQILLLMSLLCLIPFLGILLFTVHDSTNSIHQQVLAQKKEQLDKTRIQLESYKENTEIYFTSQAIKDVFFSYCYNDLDYRKYTSLKNAQNELENFSYGQRYIPRKAFFINYEYSYIIGKDFAGHFLEKTGALTSIQEGIRLAKAEHQTVKWVYLPLGEEFSRGEKYSNLLIDENVLLIPYPIFSADSQSVLLVQLDSQKIREFLTPNDKEENAIIIANENNIILYSTQPNCSGKMVEELPYLSDLDRSKREGICQIEKDEKEAYLIWLQDDSGWIYCSISSTGEITRQVSSLISTYIIFGMGAILILLLAVYMSSIWLYRPVASIASKVGLFAHDIKGKNEFQIIEKGCEQYAEQMEIYKNSLKEFFLHKLLKSSLSAADIRKEIIRTGLCPDGTDMLILVFQVLDIENSTPSPDVLAVQKIYSMLSLDSLITSTYYQGLFIVWLQNKIRKPYFEDTIRKECNLIKQEMSMESYLFALGQSLVFHEYSELLAAYLDAVKDLSSTTEDNSIIRQNNGENLTSESLMSDRNQEFYPETLCEQLATSIQNDHPNEAERLLSAISRNVYRDKKDSQQQEISIICAVSSLFISTWKRGPVPYEVFPKHPLEMITKIHNSNTMNYYFKKEFLNPLAVWIRKKGSHNQEKLTKKVIQMIQDAFYTDITLEQCAAQLNCSALYLGQLFKEQTSQTFSQYLDNYRFYMAKKWLLESDMPVTEIAEQLRYSNAQNFIRSFKKKTGITPGKYREINQS